MNRLWPFTEERALLPLDGRRPKDLLLPNYSWNRDTPLDVTVMNLLRNDFVEEEAKTPGFALGKAHERKARLVGKDCRREGIVSTPLPVETFGG